MANPNNADANERSFFIRTILAHVPGPAKNHHAVYAGIAIRIRLHVRQYVRYNVQAMNKTLSATSARKQFFKVLDLAGTPGSSVTITREGRPPLVIMSQEEFEGWQETMEIMADPELVKAIEEGKADVEAGNVITLEELENKHRKKHSKKR